MSSVMAAGLQLPFQMLPAPSFLQEKLWADTDLSLWLGHLPDPSTQAGGISNLGKSVPSPKMVQNNHL